MKGRYWLIILLAIVTVMSLATYAGVTESFFTDDEKSTDDALGIRWGLFTLNDDFENTGSPAWDANWDENGTTTWIQDTGQAYGGSVYSAYSGGTNFGYLTSDEIEASTTGNVTVSFQYFPKALESTDVWLQTYNGTGYENRYDLVGGTNNVWNLYSEVITDPQYLIAGFRVRFDSSLASGNDQIYIDDVVITTDTTPPAPPTGLAATAGDEEISLAWTSNNETDLWGYNVYRGPTSGNYTQINGTMVLTNSYTDTPLYGGGTYYYAVTAVDLGNNESGYSNEDNATANNIAPAAPTGLSANATEFQVSLDWNDNTEGDLDSYNVYRSLTSSSNYTQIESLVATSNYTDSGLTNGVTYYYVVTAVDNATSESLYSNEASDTPVDLNPAAPTGLAATGGDEEISLDWNDNTEVDINGYDVYRGDSGGGPYNKINVSLVATSNYTDTPLYGGGTYYYVVKAVDNGTNESAYSSENSTTATDIAPAVPAVLVATGGDEEISLDWNDNIETDLDGYNVYRGPNTGNTTELVGSLVATSNYTDTGLYGGGTYYYVVTAADTGTNESGNSNEDNATASNAAPAAPTGLAATGGEEEISLDWNDNTEGDLEGYNIYRGLTSGNYTYVDNVTAPTSNYTDSGLFGGGTYYYVVTAVDNLSAESGNSNEHSAVASSVPLAAPTGLLATAGDEEVSLNWDDNIEGDLDGYNVYRSLTSGANYTQVNVGLVATSNYTDTGLVNAATYYYVVTAVDTFSSESDYSNEANATPQAGQITLLDDGFEGTPWDANWDGNGTTDWQLSSAGGGYGGSTYSADHASGDTYLTTDDLDALSADNITISFWFKLKFLTKGPVYVQTYNGTSFNTLHDLAVYPGAVVNTYCYYSENITDSQYFRSDFRLRFDGSAYTSDAYIDDVFIGMSTSPPAAPTGLVATPSDGEVSLDWNDNTDPDLDGYNVYRSLTGDNYTYVDNVTAPTSNYTDTGLSNNVTYYYVVTAVDLGSNESLYSNVDSTVANVPPAAPSGLGATSGDSQVSLDWSDNSEGDLASYNVYRGLSSGNYTYIDNVVAPTSDYTDTGLSNNVTYYYVVTAVDNVTAESSNSNEDNAVANVPPAAPTGLIATAGDGQVGLDWNDNSEGDLAGYNVYRSLSSGANYTEIESLWTSSNYTDTGLTNGITYYYVVTAVDNVTAQSGYSNESSATPGDPPPAAPTGLVATSGKQLVSLDWNDNGEGDLDGYNVYSSLTSGANYTQINGVLVSTSNYTDTGLTGGVTYYYVVTAVNTLANESGYSNEDSATPWAPSLWTQTSQADFEAGVSDNVSTTLSSGNVILSAGGNAGGANMILLWDGGTAPTGWTIVSDVGGDFYQKFPRGEATYGGTGGSANHSHSATFAPTSAGSGSVAITASAGAGAATVTHTHTLASSTISTSSNLPVYRNLRVIKYTGGGGVPATIPAGAIAIFDTTLPAGWTRYSAQDNNFVQGEATASGTGGSANHTHNVSISTNTPTGTATLKTPGALTYATNTHTHSQVASTIAASNLPPYVSVILAKADSDTAVPAGMIAMFDASPTGNWDVLSNGGGDFYQNFILGSDTYGTTGGASSYSHNDQVVTLATVTGTASNGKNTASVFASATHTHTVGVTSFNAASSLPPYVNVIFAKALYYPSGTIASQVLDTTVTGSEWSELAWDRTLPSGANITFEVRASDTAFLKTDATPSWTSVGSTSPVTTGLPSGRYQQWRAILAPDGTRTNTPTLQEVRAYYQGD
ncbi:hypothetical protein ACFLWS_00720 [Chloroflexota bacterium]